MKKDRQIFEVAIEIVVEVEAEWHRAYSGATDGLGGPKLEPDEDAGWEILGWDDQVDSISSQISDAVDKMTMENLERGF